MPTIVVMSTGGVVEMSLYGPDDGMKHSGGEAAGIGIVTGTMKAIEQREVWAQNVFGAMAEWITGPLQIQRGKRLLVGDAAKSKYG